MNLVVDDAVEVKMATKDAAEARRELGMLCGFAIFPPYCADLLRRTNLAQGRQCIADTEPARLTWGNHRIVVGGRGGWDCSGGRWDFLGKGWSSGRSAACMTGLCISMTFCHVNG